MVGRTALWMTRAGCVGAPSVAVMTSSVDEWWTQRQATEHLQRLHLGRDAMRSALRAGVAGAPVRVRNGLLYRAADVRAAFDRAGEPCQILVRTELPVFVARIAPRQPDPGSTWRAWRGADLSAPVLEQRDAARAWWFLGARVAALASGIGRAMGMPFVVTCGGIIAMGAEITGLDASLEVESTELSRQRLARAREPSTYSRDATAFTLRDPGHWFDDQAGRRWSTGAGGPFRLIISRAPVTPSMES